MLFERVKTMVGPLTSYATTRMWAEGTAFLDLVSPTFYVPPPSTFREFSEASLAKLFSPLELTVPGVTRFIAKATHQRLLDESVARYGSLWASLARK
jgi:hypothetical protein